MKRPARQGVARAAVISGDPFTGTREYEELRVSWNRTATETATHLLWRLPQFLAVLRARHLEFETLRGKQSGLERSRQTEDTRHMSIVHRWPGIDHSDPSCDRICLEAEMAGNLLESD